MGLDFCANTMMGVSKSVVLLQATKAQYGSIGSNLQALLVTMLPGEGSDEHGLYFSIPVSLPRDDAAAGVTTLLVPYSKVPPGANRAPHTFTVLDIVLLLLKLYRYVLL